MSGQARLFFRFDAAPEIGAGHWRRCLALAMACARQGAEVHWLARVRGMDMGAEAARAGMRWHSLPWDTEAGEDARLLAAYAGGQDLRAGVVDHYRQDEVYQRTLQAAGLRWLQFGNRAHRHPLLGELLHDASPGACAAHYEGRLANPASRLLLGPSHALLHPAFAVERARMGGAAGGRQLRKVLVAAGGGHDRGATAAVLEWLEAAGFAGRRVILTTSANSALLKLKKLVEAQCGRVRTGPGVGIELHVDNWNPAAVMAGCELAVCAGGTTLHELACLGIPALVLSLAENQDEPGLAWQRAGMGLFLGRWPGLDEAAAVAAVRGLLRDAPLRAEMARRCWESQDGQGAARVAEALLSLDKPT